jgi:hypothetical protein
MNVGNRTSPSPSPLHLKFLLPLANLFSLQFKLPPSISVSDCSLYYCHCPNQSLNLSHSFLSLTPRFLPPPTRLTQCIRSPDHHFALPSAFLEFAVWSLKELIPMMMLH